MIQNTPYRFDRYEIIEKGNGELLWKSHEGFGNGKGGKCFVNKTPPSFVL